MLGLDMELRFRLAAGDCDKAIALAFVLSPHTVKRHVANIMGKLQNELAPSGDRLVPRQPGRRGAARRGLSPGRAPMHVGPSWVAMRPRRAMPGAPLSSDQERTWDIPGW
jgi:hypothetical protein